MRPSHYIYPGLKKNLLTPKELLQLGPKRKGDSVASLILHEVCDYFQLVPDKVKTKSRTRERVWCRQLYCYLAKKLTAVSLVEIGLHIGGRDHTTVIHSIKTATDLILRHPDLAMDASILESRVVDKLYMNNIAIKDFVK